MHSIPSTINAATESTATKVPYLCLALLEVLARNIVLHLAMWLVLNVTVVHDQYGNVNHARYYEHLAKDGYSTCTFINKAAVHGK